MRFLGTLRWLRLLRLFVACGSFARCSLLVARCSLLVARCSLLVACCALAVGWLLVAGCWSLVLSIELSLVCGEVAARWRGIEVSVAVGVWRHGGVGSAKEVG